MPTNTQHRACVCDGSGGGRKEGGGGGEGESAYVSNTIQTELTLWNLLPCTSEMLTFLTKTRTGNREAIDI